MMSRGGKVAVYIGVGLISLYILYPLYLLFLIAFTPIQYTIGTQIPSQLPVAFTLGNLRTALQGFNLIDPMIKSVEVAFLVGGIAIALGIPAAYGLSKMTVRRAGMISSTLFLANMLPAIVIAIPVSVTFLKIGLWDSVVGLALAQELIVLPLTIFLILGAFQTLPKDLENQARVDGAGIFQTLTKILIPLAKGGIVAAFLLSWMMSWDEFTFAIILSPVKQTLPIVIYENITRGNILASSAFALIVTIPVIILTVFLSKYLKGEFLSGGLVG